MQNAHYNNGSRARASTMAAGTLLALLAAYGSWRAGSGTASLVPAAILAVTLVSGWRLAIGSALLVTGGVLILQGPDAWPVALPAAISVGCAEALRRGLMPLLAALALVAAGLAANLLAPGDSTPLPLLIAAAAVQAGAGVGLACLVLMLIPRHGGWTPARPRIRWAHVSFCLLAGSASIAAMALLSVDSDAGAAARSIGVTATAFVATEVLTRWLESATRRLGERYMTHRALAAAGIVQRRIRELPLEVLRLVDRLHREKSQLRRSSNRAGRKLLEAQRTAAQALHELHAVRETLDLKSSRLHTVTRSREDLRERLHVLLESSADALLFVSEQGIVEAANGSTTAMLGYPPATLAGKAIGTLVPAEYMLDHPLDLGSRRPLEAPTGTVLCEILLADGRRREIGAQVHPFPIRENRHYLVRLHEPDHMKNALATLEEARELTRNANQSRHLFVATMSHELRTPLHGLIATLDLLRAEDLRTDLQHHLAIARTSARALLKIANDVLDLSRLGSNLFPLERKLFALPGILRETVDEARARATTLGLSVSVEVAGSLPTSF